MEKSSIVLGESGVEVDAVLVLDWVWVAVIFYAVIYLPQSRVGLSDDIPLQWGCTILSERQGLFFLQGHIATFRVFTLKSVLEVDTILSVVSGMVWEVQLGQGFQYLLLVSAVFSM